MIKNLLLITLGAAALVFITLQYDLPKHELFLTMDLSKRIAAIAYQFVLYAVPFATAISLAIRGLCGIFKKYSFRGIAKTAEKVPYDAFLVVVTILSMSGALLVFYDLPLKLYEDTFFLYTVMGFFSVDLFVVTWYPGLLNGDS